MRKASFGKMCGPVLVALAFLAPQRGADAQQCVDACAHGRAVCAMQGRTALVACLQGCTPSDDQCRGACIDAHRLAQHRVPRLRARQPAVAALPALTRVGRAIHAVAVRPVLAQIRLAGEGGPGIYGGPNGSLFLLLNVKPHQFFKRREDDILLNLDINIAQAALGAEVMVPTLDGDEKLKIPAGTQPGKVFHMKGKGVPHLRRKEHRGDQMVIVNVDIPAKLTKEQREIFEKLSETLGTAVKPKEKGFLDWLNEALGG